MDDEDGEYDGLNKDGGDGEIYMTGERRRVKLQKMVKTIDGK